jgi:hypothetical protein
MMKSEKDGIGGACNTHWRDVKWAKSFDPAAQQPFGRREEITWI